MNYIQNFEKHTTNKKEPNILSYYIYMKHAKIWLKASLCCLWGVLQFFSLFYFFPQISLYLSISQPFLFGCRWSFHSAPFYRCCNVLLLFPADIRYESMINTMLKDLFELLVACVAKPTETISRVGCSCIRWEKGSLAFHKVEFYYGIQRNSIFF